MRRLLAAVAVAVAVLAAPAAAAPTTTITTRATYVQWSDGHHEIRITVRGARALVTTADPREHERYSVLLPTSDLRQLLADAQNLTGGSK